LPAYSIGIFAAISRFFIAIGRGSEKVKKILESGYKKDMKLKDAIALVRKAIKSIEKVEDTNIEIAVISKEGVKITNIAELNKRV